MRAAKSKMGKHDDAAQDKKLIRSEFKKMEAKEGPEKYADGGEVMAGKGARPRLDRGARKAPGKGKPKTNINIINAPGGKDAGPPMPPPMAGPPGPPPGPMPPMPMRKNGGPVPKMTAGAESGPGRLQKVKAYGKNARSGEGK